MPLKLIKPNSSASKDQVQQIMNALDGTSDWADSIQMRTWSPFDSNYWKKPIDFKLKLEVIDEEPDVTKTPRNLYFFAIVDDKDQIDLQSLVAENEQVARDTIVQDNLRGKKAKDVEIKLLRADTLKPRVTKDA